MNILPTFEEQKKKIIKSLKREGYVKSQKVIDAFMRVPRELFVPSKLKDYAYSDTPLPIGYGQTISAIHMVLFMCELLDLEPGHKVLEVGTGSGYHAAIIAEIVSPSNSEKKGHVYTIERIEPLAEFAIKNLERAGYSDRVTVILGDGTMGYPDFAPYDRISVTASGPTIPKPLVEQLAINGKMVLPMGRHSYWQELYLIKKKENGDIEKISHGGVAFVPLIGKYGWTPKSDGDDSWE